MLDEDVPPRTMPAIDVGDNLFACRIEGQLATTGNGNARLPGQGCRPVQGPVGVDEPPFATNLVQVHVDLAKPGLHEFDGVAKALHAMEFIEGIFEINVIGVNCKGLILREAPVIGPQYLKQG